MKPIRELLLLCSVTILLAAAEPSKPPLFQLRLVLDQPTADSERMTMVRPSKDGQSVPVVLHVAKGALLDEADIKSAQFQADPISGRPQVGITFTEQGKKAFAEVTRTNLNKQLAILIDGKVVSAPVIRTEIRDGKAIIDGNFTEQEAKDLAARIDNTLQEKGAIKPWRHGPYDQLRPTLPE